MHKPVNQTPKECYKHILPMMSNYCKQCTLHAKKCGEKKVNNLYLL